MLSCEDGRGGFTLLENLIAVAVLAVGLLGLVAFFPGAIRTGAEVDWTLHASEELRSIQDALRISARERSYAHWPGAPRAGEPSAVFLLLEHPACRGAQPPDPTDPAVLEHRACVRLPHGRSEVLFAPAASGPRDSPESRAEDVLYLPEPAAGDRAARPRLGFRLRVQRASVHGRPRDGLYLVTVLLHRGSGTRAGDYRRIVHATIELAVGPTAEVGVGSRVRSRADAPLPAGWLEPPASPGERSR